MTTTAINLDTVTLGKGSHASRDAGMCAMEMVAYLNNEPHSDHPVCACPVLTAFVISVNDNTDDEVRRTEMLRPFLPRLIGTRSTAEVERKRSMLALDWLIRVYTPAWLDLVPSLRVHTESYRALAPIVDIETAKEAGVLAPKAKADAAAAKAAAWDALAPTSSKLQASSLDLLDRMIKVTA